MNNGKPRYGAVAKGKIVDGVLITQPIDLKLPFYGNSAYAEIDLRDMNMKLDLTLGDDGKVRGS